MSSAESHDTPHITDFCSRGARNNEPFVLYHYLNVICTYVCIAATFLISGNGIQTVL